ncbi:MAG: sigma-54-dependent Fis family transcriptional regulator, partial [Pedobacter sp.]
MAKILILEDDTTFAQLLEGFLTKNNHEITLVTHIKQSFKLIENETFDLLLIDYRLPDGIGFEVITHVRNLSLSIPIIIMTSFNDVRTAVKSMQMGAFDYITKPVNPDELLMVIKNSLTKKDSKEIKLEATDSDFIKGKSAIADKLYEHIALVAPTDMSVIIQGESGTGKEFAART